jgi:hypothetical protein
MNDDDITYVICTSIYSEVTRYDLLNINRSLEALVPWFMDGFILLISIDS